MEDPGPARRRDHGLRGGGVLEMARSHPAGDGGPFQPAEPPHRVLLTLSLTRLRMFATKPAIKPVPALSPLKFGTIQDGPVRCDN